MIIFGLAVFCGHLEFGSNPTADVPITNQLRPMQASVILVRVTHSGFSFSNRKNKNLYI